MQKFWLFNLNALSLLTFGTRFILGLVLARLIVPEDFGFFAICLALSKLMLIPRGGLLKSYLFSLSKSALLSETRNVVSFTYGLVIFCSIFAASAVFFLEMTQFVVILTLVLNNLIADLFMVSEFSLRKERRFGLLFGIDLLSMLLGGGFAVLAAINNFPLLALVILSFSEVCIPSLTKGLWVNPFCYPNFEREAMKRIWVRHVRGFYCVAIGRVADTFDTLALGYLVSSDYVGNYSRSKTFSSLPFIVSNAMSFVTESKVGGENLISIDKKRTVHNLSFGFSIFGLFSSFAIPFSDSIITLLYGDQWVGSAILVPPCVTLAIATLIFSNIRTFLANRNSLRDFFIIEFSRLLGMVVAGLTGYLIYGYVGLIWGVALASLCLAIFFLKAHIASINQIVLLLSLGLLGPIGCFLVVSTREIQSIFDFWFMLAFVFSNFIAITFIIRIIFSIEQNDK